MLRSMNRMRITRESVVAFGTQWYIDHAMVLNATERALWLSWAQTRKLDSAWIAPHATSVDLIEVPGVEGSHADDVAFCDFIREADAVGIDVQLDVELDGEFGGDAGDAGDSSSVPAIPGVGREDSFVLDDDDGNDHELSDELEAAEASAWAEAPALGDAGFEGGDESMMSSDGMTSSVLVTSTYQADEVLGKSDQWAVV